MGTVEGGFRAESVYDLTLRHRRAARGCSQRLLPHWAVTRHRRRVTALSLPSRGRPQGRPCSRKGGNPVRTGAYSLLARSIRTFSVLVPDVDCCAAPCQHPMGWNLLDVLPLQHRQLAGGKPFAHKWVSPDTSFAQKNRTAPGAVTTCWKSKSIFVSYPINIRPDGPGGPS